MCRPRCCGGGARGARGDKRLSGGPLTPALPREMSEEAAGWQTSRCTLKKPWRLAGAYPNLCRRQISPGSPRRREHSLFWHQINQMQNGRQLGLLWIQRPPRRHLDSITLSRIPRRVSIWRDVKGKEKREKEKAERQGHSQMKPHPYVSGSWSREQLFAARIKPNAVFGKKKWFLLRGSGTCSPVLKGWGLLFVCTALKEGSKRAISASRRKENRSPSTENISAWHNVQAHWHARKSISLTLSRGIPALLCAVPAVWPWVNHLASLRIKHPSYQRPSVELSEHW